MASPKKLFAKLNISIKIYLFLFPTRFSDTFAVLSLIYFLHIQAFFLFHILFKVFKSNVHRRIFSVYILMSHLHFPWDGYGEGSGI